MKKIITVLMIISMLFATVILTSCDAVEVISGIGKILGFIKPLIEEHTHVTGPMPDIESTCMEHGRTGGMMCLTCGEILVEPTEAPLAPHRYDGDDDPTCSWCNYERYCMHRNTRRVAGKAATCRESGYTESEVCLDCNATIILAQEIPLAAHTEGILDELESTCYSTGLTEGKYCTVCETVLVPQKEAPLKPHAESILEAVESSCTKTGLTQGKRCTTCNKILVSQQEAPLKNHTYSSDSDTTCNACPYTRACTHAQLVILSAKAPTCTQTGLTEGKKCDLCNEIVIAQTSVPVKDHTEVTIPAVSATCTQTGLAEGKKCSVCNEILTAQAVVALKAHTEASIPAVSSTCTKTGLTEGKKCSVCDKILTAQTVVALRAHTEVAIPAVPATCTGTGLTEGKKCSVCDKILLSQSVEPIKNHTYSSDSDLSCNVCSYVRECNHSNTAVLSAKASTCTSTGLTEGKKCTVCNEILIAQSVTAIIPHTESEWIIDTAATETTEGAKHTECTVCKVVLKQEKITENVIYSLTTKTGWVSKSSSTNPGLKYSAEIQYRNRTEESVEVRIVWTATITKGSYDRYGQYFKFSIGSVSSGNVKVVSFDTWKNTSSSDRSKTAASSWVTVPLSSTDAASISLSVYYWQTNSKGTDMYKYDGTPCVKATWSVTVPAAG